jgi:hypothetical protein
LLARERARCLDRAGSVTLTAQEREEHRDQLVADELVDEAVVVEDHRRGGVVEAVHELAEVGGRHPLGERRRAADVGEEHGDLDLGAAVIAGHEHEARPAPVRILLRRPLPDHSHQRRADTGERSRA